MKELIKMNKLKTLTPEVRLYWSKVTGKVRVDVEQLSSTKKYINESSL